MKKFYKVVRENSAKLQYFLYYRHYYLLLLLQSMQALASKLWSHCVINRKGFEPCWFQWSDVFMSVCFCVGSSSNPVYPTNRVVALWAGVQWRGGSGAPVRSLFVILETLNRPLGDDQRHRFEMFTTVFRCLYRSTSQSSHSQWRYKLVI